MAATPRGSGIAESEDGIHFKHSGEPVFYPAEDDQKTREWPGGVEDPRIVEREDGTYVLTYTQWNRETYSVGVASSRDLKHWTKHGPAFLTALGGKYADLKYKSAGILTKVKDGRPIAAKVNGRYWMYWGEGSIRLATSDDAIHWTPVEGTDGRPVELLRPRPGHFDSTFPETGPPPVLTSAGIVVLYNGKNAEHGGDPALGPSAYAAGEALFDGANPAHLLTQTDRPVLKPELPYEKTGQYAAGTTFAEGLVYFHGKWFLYYGCADSLVAVATAPAEAMSADSLRMPISPEIVQLPLGSGPKVLMPLEAEENARGFYLHNGDTVVFYGDSITEQNYYNQWVQVYVATRFPWMRVHFYGAGIGGDRVTGGWAGPIDQRLDRDVFSEKPTVVTVMLGMNDGAYQATTDEIEQTYVKGYQHLLDSIREHVPGVRLTLLGPSPFDDVTRPVTFPGGYNAAMQHFAEIDQSLADKYAAVFVNLNPPVVAAIQKADAMDAKIAPLLLPDRVHPDPLAHWVMAEALLKGWHAPALVSEVTLDAHAGAVVGARNASVSQVEQTDKGLKWSELEYGLPLPLTRSNATQALLEDLTDIEKQLNQEILRITRLSPGRYTLSIDGNPVDTFSPEALEDGINLADYPTPMFHQAQTVGWLVRDRNDTHFIHARMRARNADTGSEEGKDVMQAFENMQEDLLYVAAQPKPHVFRLTPVPAGTTQSTKVAPRIRESEILQKGFGISSISLASVLETDRADLCEVNTHAAGPEGSLPLTAEMLVGEPSGNLFGLSQNAGMGWDPRRLLDPEFLILSTHGGLRAENGDPIALGFHTGHWEVGLLVSEAARELKALHAVPFAGACTDPCDGRTQGTAGMMDSLPFRNDAAMVLRRLMRSLPTRKGVLGIATCDKGLPAMMMALASAGAFPAVLVPGGVTLLPEVGEDAGKVQTIGARFAQQQITLQYAQDIGCRACASPGGGCQFLGTAATAQVVGEALGLSLPHTALAPSGQPIWLDAAKRSARAMIRLHEFRLGARDVLTDASVRNAMVLHAAFGGSTNLLLHLPAIAFSGRTQPAHAQRVGVGKPRSPTIGGCAAEWAARLRYCAGVSCRRRARSHASSA